jgi:hypothetical protein
MPPLWFCATMLIIFYLDVFTAAAMGLDHLVYS